MLQVSSKESIDQKLIDGGVTHIFLQSPQQDQAKVIKFYGEQVLPRL